MSTPLLPDLDQVLSLNAQLAERYGGERGVSAPEVLRSTLCRPLDRCGGGILDEAAWIFAQILIERPFAGANARTAFAVLDIILRLNGHRIALHPEALLGELRGLCSTHTPDPEQIRLWVHRLVEQPDLF
ncbi:hypothetical protein [Thioalkalivibrio thiocyanodenitrificans]|uniref:hypothetical protein n=1 Tax=Thioalkalivibrio thiocyanodenitrificans TaxID=243063 RepID=UPI00036EEEFC|nr:hypothetical protein [Thioalkalivibrio thiocyanodenitrificans]